jgi:acid stress-induced BolA-like protein IbaG/YrbA
MDPTEVARLIEIGLPQSDVRVMSDDNTHYQALIVSEMFTGKRAIARHQLVYQCLGSLMGNEIHAMSIRAHTPDEWLELQATDEAAGEAANETANDATDLVAD